MNELFIRTVAGLILGLIAISGVWYLPSFLFKLVIAFLISLSVWELSGILKKHFYLIKRVELGLISFLCAVLELFVDVILSGFLFMVFSFYRSYKVGSIEYLFVYSFIFIYGVLFISTLGFLHEIDKKLIFVLFATVWAGDTAAYFIGKRFGRRKLAPKLSPKKTWEGAFGSLVGSLLFGIGTAYFLNIQNVYMPVLIASVLMQVGDLFESFIKRQFGVKDSSNIIPGHGGVLDRIDALIFASVVFYTFYRIFPL